MVNDPKQQANLPADYPSAPLSTPPSRRSGPDDFGTTETAPLGRYIRWQALLALMGVVVLTSLLGYSAYSVSTVLVADRGGVYREGVAGNPQTINPLLAQMHEVDQDLCALLFRGLTQFNTAGETVPDLADYWTVTPDGTTYTFHLRPNQFWHDGQPVTAADVVFTTGVMQDQDFPGVPDLAELWRSVDVEQVDDLTVRFTLKQAFMPFQNYTTIGLLPAHLWRDVPVAELASSPLNQAPVGNGPMKIAEVTADIIRLEPNPFYGDSTPYVSALEFHFYPDYPSLFAAYQNNEIDGISRILPGDLPIAANRQDLQLFSAVESGYLVVVFNLRNADVPFFQDTSVRQALVYGLDREKLITDAAQGQGVLAHSPLLTESWAYNQDVKQYPYNPVLARQLLESSGWVDSNGDGVRERDGRLLSFVLLTNEDPVHQRLIEEMAAAWREIGVQAVPQPISFAGLVSDFLTPRRFDAALISWAELAGDPDPYPLWHSSQVEEGGQNFSGWATARADEILEEARSLTDQEARRQLYVEFQDIFAEEMPALLLYYPIYTYGVSDRVKNVQIGPLNHSADRFATFADWYIVTRRVPANQIPTTVPPMPPQ
jgi:peptide/nickel transport system substrate-binding protein